jgi:transposase
MQLQLPFFPKEATLVSQVLGVYERDGIVQYIVNGLPVYCHEADNMSSFRFITSNFIARKLCRKADVERCFGVSESSVQRWYNVYLREGERGFFGTDGRKGIPTKMVDSRLQRIQTKIDQGQSVNSIAAAEGVAEATIRYWKQKGYLKKRILE